MAADVAADEEGQAEGRMEGGGRKKWEVGASADKNCPIGVHLRTPHLCAFFCGGMGI